MVIGGHNGREYQNVAMTYNIKENEWTDVAKLPRKAAFCGATILEKQQIVVVAGGRNDKQRHRTINFFPLEQENDKARWQTHHEKLDQPREQFVLAPIDSQGYGFAAFGGISGEDESITSKRFAQPKLHAFVDDGSTTSNLRFNDAASTSTDHFGFLANARPAPSSERVVSVHEINHTGSPATVCTTTTVIPEESWVAFDHSDSFSISQINELVPPANHVKEKLLKDGKGRDITYTGSVNDDQQPNGRGSCTYESSDTLRYKGSWENGLRHGHGKTTFVGGNWFDGEYQEDERFNGKFYSRQERFTYEGQFKNQTFNGEGKIWWYDGSFYTGHFRDGYREDKNGYMETKYGTHTEKYEGGFSRGRYNGRGKLIKNDGTVYEGIFKNGRAHGRGILKHADGTVAMNGQWKNDEFIG